MKKFAILLSLILTAKLSFGMKCGVNNQEYLLLAIPASILILMFFYSFIKRKIKQMIIAYKEKKTQLALEEEYTASVDEFILLT